MGFGGTNLTGGMPGSPGRRPCCGLSTLGPGGHQVLGSDTTGLYQSRHIYGAGPFEFLSGLERSGQLYTCALGFVDLGHVRDCIDLTRYYYRWIRRRHRRIQVFIPFHYGGHIQITRDLSSAEYAKVAASIAFDQAMFHEIYTYWDNGIGAHHSSFSPEDLVSNLLGTYVGEKAIAAVNAGRNGSDFNRNATAELRTLLTALHTVTEIEAYDAFSKILLGSGGLGWIAGGNPAGRDHLLRRNFSYNPVQPWIVPGVLGCPSGSHPLPPDLSLEFPSQIRESYNALFIVPEDPPSIRFAMGGIRELNVTDFDRRIRDIKADARSLYGPDFDRP